MATNCVSFPQPNNLTEQSRQVFSPTTVKTTYRAGYTAIVVKSTFVDEKPLEDLLFTVIQQRLNDKRKNKQHSPFHGANRAV